ncbi:hypothetical protein QBC34DRAFT_469965 [Podospora aff. communis PSN243]|uniref:WSC domain-containing protein n=1 Tax=Podospora aff. communis PSN243 TaxID=3040156 RepID=A0AAV9GF33_9PEZI|nr:hypothetical protein QBC34DRAFT_469965 [Podospora aff. communis PSN243]
MRLLRLRALLGVCAFLELSHLAQAQQGPLPSPPPELETEPMVRPGRRWTAFGDSYSAGIGAGQYDDVPNGIGGACHRATGSFAVQLMDSPTLKGSWQIHPPEFQFLACSGAVMSDVLGGQLDTFRANLPLENDYATITIGGNDAGFANYLLACLYNIPWYNCATTKVNTHNRLRAMREELVKVYSAIIDAATEGVEGRNEFLLHVLGYPRFFSTATNECDGYSFAIFNSASSRLTVELRSEINDLVLDMNQAIMDAVEMVNAQHGYDRARFVDVDPYYEGHRFCEPGQSAPTNGDETWFFLLWGGDAPPGFDDDDDTPTPTPAQCDALGADPTATLGDDHMAMLLCNGGVWDWHPIGRLKRIFHPKTRAYQETRDAIEHDWRLLPSEKLYPVLIMFEGPVKDFDDMIAALDDTAARGRQSRVWEQDGVDLRGYSFWLTRDDAAELERENPGVVGISFETRQPFNITVKPSAEATKHRRMDSGDPQDTLSSPRAQPASGNVTMMSGMPSHDQDNIRGVLNRRQTTTGSLRMQSTPDGDQWGLKYLSTPPAFHDEYFYHYPGFVHNENAGDTAIIYVVDTGVKPDPEFGSRLLPGFTGEEIVGNHVHGTTIASVAAGRTVGVSRAARIVPVKIMGTRSAPTGDGTQGLFATNLFQGLLWILKNADDRGAGRRAVINFSISYGIERFIGPLRMGEDRDSASRRSDPWYHFLPRFATRGIPVVCGVGNGDEPPANAHQLAPSRFAMNGEVAADTLIVAGASNKDGLRWTGIINGEQMGSNNFASVTAYAPGEDVRAVVSGGLGPATGTSVAAGYISGLIAGWLVRSDIRDRLGQENPSGLVFTRRVKAFVREVAVYATNPSKTAKGKSFPLVGTYDYIPCIPDPVATLPAASGSRIRDENGVVYTVNGLTCQGNGLVAPPQVEHFRQPLGDGNLAACAQNCLAGENRFDFVMFGLRNGQCFCDRKLRAEPAPAAVSDDRCTRPCDNSAGLRCGGPGHMSLYTLTGTLAEERRFPTLDPPRRSWLAKGCINNVLIGLAPTLSGPLTPQACADACEIPGSETRYFSLRGGHACRCGSWLRRTNPDGSAGPDTTARAERIDMYNCNKACDGDEAWLCGGETNDAILLYQLSRPSGQHSLVGGWEYQGCYEDAETRVLGGPVYGGQAELQPSTCAALCEGWRYFGVENGNECFCGNELDHATEGNEEDCSAPCTGDGDEVCGGNWRIGIWEDTDWQAEEEPTPSTSSATPTATPPQPPAGIPTDYRPMWCGCGD